jgi:NAD(P)H dehydrogenase (quinone)
MKINIIYSNHHGGNFNSQLLDTLKHWLLNKGHELVIRDLYQMNFNPVLTKHDFERMAAGNTPEDIAKEQDMVKWADVMIFMYPVWWGGMPAILKGYIDRIFTSGFAYHSNGSGTYPLLNDKKAIIMSTMGQARADYEKGMFAAMNLVNVEGIFRFCGVEVVDQLYFPSIHSVSESEKEAYLQQAIEIMDKTEELSQVNK